MKYSESNKPIACMMKNSTCYKETYAITPKGVLWHSTGANNTKVSRYVQPYETDSNYNEMIALLGKNSYKNDWNHIYLEAGVNAFIGKIADGSVATVQVMPWNYRPWGCGAGSKGSCNNGWIQFEICESSLTDKVYFDAVYKEACELTAYLCKMYNLNPNGYVTLNGVNVPVILCHADSNKLGFGSNHGDVLHWFEKHGKTMDDVRNDVAKLMKTTTTTTTTPSSSTTTTQTTTTTNNTTSTTNNSQSSALSNTQAMIYRIRKSWSNVASQIGAYVNLNSAKKICDEAGSGYFVFDSSGNVVYPAPAFKAGDVVRLSSDAKYTSGKAVPKWVINSKLYVREIQGDDIVISILKVGPITGAVNKKYLTKA